ncbi:MAG: hypothetical protein GX895_04425 [Clostridiales bacterium]|uniref:hypothetical protein n=1 Tax=Clostridium sp. N3C TaxID=1776758 RepID=UPI00092E1237|nr:hypothetical protein [Clostridium sp. N3C]NLZ48026.1 hypothetical protein [Clostridiales bacterium]SCN24179.1 hypothetical protein N3C_1692 [Clostridium sp. N3C]
MFFLFLLALLIAAGEYIYFESKLERQRKTILLLTKQNEKFRRKTSKENITFSTVNINYSEPSYGSGYTTDNSYIFLSPLDNSPIVYQCLKSIKVSILDKAEVLNKYWYQVSIPSTNKNVIKGWMKESDIKFIVEEAFSNG